MSGRKECNTMEIGNVYKRSWVHNKNSWGKKQKKMGKKQI